MLRVMMPQAPPQEDETQETPQQESAESPEHEAAEPDESDSPTTMDDDDVGLPKLSPECAVYMGPEAGPFKCANCVYFEDKGACHIVSGPIEAEGCCNLFTAKNENTAAPTDNGGGADSGADGPYAPES